MILCKNNPDVFLLSIKKTKCARAFYFLSFLFTSYWEQFYGTIHHHVLKIVSDKGSWKRMNISYSILYLLNFQQLLSSKILTYSLMIVLYNWSLFKNNSRPLRTIFWMDGKMSKTKIIQMSIDRYVENESVLKYNSPSPSPSILHVHLHLSFLFSTFFHHTDFFNVLFW